MSDGQRLRLLEKNGEVFLDAEIREYQLAQKTSWWGKPLNPTNFWMGRVLWLDAEARAAAHRHGREWPPMPYKDSRLPQYPKDDRVDWSWGTPEGPSIHYGSSSEERAFWTLFAREHPKPADDLEACQYEIARRALEQWGRAQHEKIDLPALQTTPGFFDSHAGVSLKTGYPREAFSENALFWAYVLGQRKQYQELVQRGHPPESLLVKRLADDLPVKVNYVTEPLTQEQLKAASAWKSTYLRRLRKEKTDEAYIQAYLKIWSLSPTETFPEDQNK